ncbi:MAG: HAD hydrolase-like protein [Muricomes sp.]
MDGTLIDSIELWRNLGREYLESKNITENLDGILEEIQSLTMSESAALFAERFALAESPDAVSDEMNGIMEVHYRKDIPLKPGVKEHLEQLQQAGVRMCVVSATAEHL